MRRLAHAALSASVSKPFFTLLSSYGAFMNFATTCARERARFFQLYHRLN
jgi:hypothetical protein